MCIKNATWLNEIIRNLLFLIVNDPTQCNVTIQTNDSTQYTFPVQTNNTSTVTIIIVILLTLCAVIAIILFCMYRKIKRKRLSNIVM